MPKVSIIIPFREDRGWLKLAITSARNQTYPDTEIILAKGDKTCAGNTNDGIRNATGDLIKFLHDDDVLPIYAIAEMVKGIERYDFVHGNAIEIHPDGSWKRYVPEMKNPKLKDLVKKNVIHGGTTMYRREVFHKVGTLNEDLPGFEDYEFHLRLLQAGMKLGYIDNELTFYRIHNDQLTGKRHTWQQQRSEMIKRFVK